MGSREDPFGITVLPGDRPARGPRWLVTLEGLFPDDQTGVDACALDDELGPLHESLQEEELDTWAVMMAIVEGRTGMRLEDQWFATSQPAVALSDAFRAAPDRSGRAYCYADPELESALLLAPESADDAFVRELADVLVPAPHAPHATHVTHETHETTAPASPVAARPRPRSR